MDTSTVDFGQRGDFDVVSSLKIDVPGNYTDEEGYAVFHGEAGQDFQHTRVTQRTYLNRYYENERGRTGRWLVIDYEIDSSQELTRPVYVIQMMDVDLGIPDDDSFSWVSERNMTVIHQGTTFIGLSLFHFGSSSYFGHNGGQISSSTFDGEDKIFSHMYSPNNQTTSGTGQNWYMDMVAKVPGPDVSKGVHVSFAVVVGSSIEDLVEALFDAKAALTGYVQMPSTEGWRPIKSLTTMYLDYFGPFIPPYALEATNRFSTSMIGDFSPWESDQFLSGFSGAGRTLVFILDGSPSGRHQYNITPLNQWGFTDRPTVWEWKVDNFGPSTYLERDENAPTGILRVNATANDAYSGVNRIYMALNDGPFEERSILSTNQQGTDLSVRAYATDLAGNKGQEFVLDHIMNDGGAPTLGAISLSPSDLDEDTTGDVKFELTASDPISGLDQTSGRFKYGVDSPSSQWEQLDYEGGAFKGYIDIDWEASQGRDLYIEVEVKDRAGNAGSKLLTEHIEQVNDPPAYSIKVLSPPWQKDTINIEMVGSDPDGDPVSFLFQYSLTKQGPYQVFTSSSVKKLDPSRFQLTVPALIYEGELFLEGEASDGKNTTSVRRVSTWIDREGPELELIGPAFKEWYNAPKTVQVTAQDGGSGMLGAYFIVRTGQNERRVDGSEMTISDEGSHRITAYATDVSGNTGILELGGLGIDLTPPLIKSIAIVPALPGIGDNIAVELTYLDMLSGPKSISGRDLSGLLTVQLLVNGRSIIPQSVQPIPGLSDRARALFISPFAPGDERFTISVRGVDLAGNEFRVVADPFDIEDPPKEDLLGLTYPSSIGVGEDFVVTSNWTGPIHLEASYPGTNRTWIIVQKRKEDDVRSFYLPGPYSEGKVLFRAHYGAPGTETTDSIFPSNGYLEVEITGYLDGDGDGLCDEWELRYGLDTSVKDDKELDQDDDGLTLLQEARNLTDPKRADTDDDSVPDEWEARMGTLPFEKDSDQDPDGDGWSNGREYDLGTDPRDPEDHPEDLPTTPWYWTILIFGMLLAVLIYFAFQMFRRKRLGTDLERFDEEVSWDDGDK